MYTTVCSCSVDETAVLFFVLCILLICLPDVWSSHYIVCNNASLARHTAGSADKRNSTTFGSLRYLPRPTATARPGRGYVAVSICRPPTSYSTRRMRTELGGMTKSAAGCNNVVLCLESDEDELVSGQLRYGKGERERANDARWEYSVALWRIAAIHTPLIKQIHVFWLVDRVCDDMSSWRHNNQRPVCRQRGG